MEVLGGSEVKTLHCPATVKGTKANANWLTVHGRRLLDANGRSCQLRAKRVTRHVLPGKAGQEDALSQETRGTLDIISLRGKGDQL